MELATATLTLTVGASTDDAVLNDSGYQDDSTTSSAAEVIGQPGAATTAANSGQGWRFTNVTLAAADTVNSANLKLMKSGTQFSTYANRFTAIAEDNTATFSSGSAPGSRAITTGSIAVESLNTNQVDGTVYNHPSTGALQTTLGAAVAAVTARAGWASGNALAIVNQSKQDASQGAGFSRKTFHDWDSAVASSEPQLVIDYTAGASGPPIAGMEQSTMTSAALLRY